MWQCHEAKGLLAHEQTCRTGTGAEDDRVHSWGTGIRAVHTHTMILKQATIALMSQAHGDVPWKKMCAQGIHKAQVAIAVHTPPLQVCVPNRAHIQRHNGIKKQIKM